MNNQSLNEASYDLTNFGNTDSVQFTNLNTLATVSVARQACEAEALKEEEQPPSKKVKIEKAAPVMPINWTNLSFGNVDTAGNLENIIDLFGNENVTPGALQYLDDQHGNALVVQDGEYGSYANPESSDYEDIKHPDAQDYSNISDAITDEEDEVVSTTEDGFGSDVTLGSEDGSILDDTQYDADCSSQSDG